MSLNYIAYALLLQSSALIVLHVGSFDCGRIANSQLAVMQLLPKGHEWGSWKRCCPISVTSIWFATNDTTFFYIYIYIYKRQLHICNLYVDCMAIKINYTKLKTYVHREEKLLMDAQRNKRVKRMNWTAGGCDERRPNDQSTRPSNANVDERYSRDCCCCRAIGAIRK